ncbi:MAG: hypothetical protein HZB38_14150 [Planctomycetes bacterium]|nr:hypothetical protein [Planctomycetota bacterium]
MNRTGLRPLAALLVSGFAYLLVAASYSQEPTPASRPAVNRPARAAASRPTASQPGSKPASRAAAATRPAATSKPAATRAAGSRAEPTHTAAPPTESGALESKTGAVEEGRRTAPPVAEKIQLEGPAKLLEKLPNRTVLAPLSALRPALSGSTLTWIAVVMILALTLQTRPLFRWHNLDGIMLALSAVALSVRGETASLGPTGPTLQQWSYLVLTLIALYWVARGVQVAFARTLPGFGPNVSEGAMTIFVIAALAMGLNSVVYSPLSEASRDALAGGIYMAETGRLPYGELPGREARSPLLYTVYAGAVKLLPPSNSDGPMVWANRAQWLTADRMSAVDPNAARMVNGALFVLLFGGVAWLGHRLHSVALGQTLVVLLVVFPGTLECLSQPDILLPATLLAWSLAFLTVPVVGSFFAALLLVTSGLAWPWAWLGLPPLLAFALRRGWHGFSVVLATLACLAGMTLGLRYHVRPTLPRVDGALAAAGFQPNFVANLDESGAVAIEKAAEAKPPSADFKARLWQALLQAESTPVDSNAHFGPSIDPQSVLFRGLEVAPAARPNVQEAYRKATAELPHAAYLATALRSVLECVQFPETRGASALPTPWKLWFEGGPDGEQGSVLARRIGKGLLGLMVLLLCVFMLRGPRPERHQLFGALLAVAAGAVLASETGATANWIWLMPAILALPALHASASGGPKPMATPAPRTGPPAYPLRPSSSLLIADQPEPRISVEK